MTTTYNNWTQGLPGISGVVHNKTITSSSNGIGLTSAIAPGNLSIGTTNSNALMITKKGGEPLITFHNDGVIETEAGKIKVDEWIQIINVMKKFIVDVAQDPEMSEKYPYIRDMAHTWVMDELGK